MDSGKLHYDSRVKPTKIFTLDKRKIAKKLAELNITTSKEIVDILNQSIEINVNVAVDMN